MGDDVTVRLRDLDVTGWALLAVGGWTLFHALSVTTAVLFGAGGSPGVALLLAVLGAAALWVVDHSARPEVAGHCLTCGTPVEVNSGTDSNDMAITVPRAGAPERIGEEPLSIVRSRDYDQATFCSPTCAETYWDAQPTPTHGTVRVGQARAERTWTSDDGVVTDGGDDADARAVEVSEVIDR